MKTNTNCNFCSSAMKAVHDCLVYFKNDFEVASSPHEPYKKESVIVNVSAPCVEACPIHQDVPGYINLIKNGRYDDALELIKRNNPLPECSGNACMANCERNCVRRDIDKPVAIRALKRVACEYGTSNPVEPTKLNGEKVAIIGAGPAGIAAAKRLISLGYRPVIFEMNNGYGGMLSTGIPEYRLPQEIINKDYNEIIKLGAEFRGNTPISQVKDISGAYKATIICNGATLSRPSNIEGWTENDNGMYQGIHYLKSVYNKKIMPVSEHVVVVGGGNTTIDCARTALRQGATDVTILYRRTMSEMPAYKEEIDAAIKEGIKFEFLTIPVKVQRGENKVVEVVCQKIELGEPDESGRPRPIPIPGTEYTIYCDKILSCIGELPDTSIYGSKINLTDDGRVLTDKYGATSAKGIFAAGDCVNGPSSMAEAMASGKRAAEGVDLYLNKNSKIKQSKQEVFDTYHQAFLEKNVDEAFNFKMEKQESPVAELTYIRDNYEQVEKVLSKEQAEREAERCIKCYKVMMIARD
jgi:formate dehydrogenase beta subunit